MIEGKTASQGAAEGLDLCIRTIIPSLFPFFVLTSYLHPWLTNINFPVISALGKLLSIPSGQESTLLLGFLGGYPVGAQLIGESYRNGQLSKENATILMGYCNHAGPAFLFGITAKLFHSPVIPWVLWGVHILSGILTAIILPRCHSQHSVASHITPITFPQALRSAITICSSVCGWIILFKALLSLLQKWFIKALHGVPFIFISGLLELSNGCFQLAELSSQSARFIFCSAFLSFGGFCVAMQAASAAVPLGLGLYFPGKMIETLTSIGLSILVSWLQFDDSLIPLSQWCIYLFFSLIIITLLRNRQLKKLWKLQTT